MSAATTKMTIMISVQGIAHVEAVEDSGPSKGTVDAASTTGRASTDPCTRIVGQIPLTLELSATEAPGRSRGMLGTVT